MTAPLRITLAGYQGPGSVHTRGMEVFRGAMTRQLGERVEVVVRPNVGPEEI
ncbi:hypothetical protein [Gymnodinialimonas sp. 57CJ19]|uniref:hypothetical protein n=1 Tax=Gymnodinialimonas sp. 57CJ19 TaxID=3138498 RepID=UPI003134328C